VSFGKNPTNLIHLSVAGREERMAKIQMLQLSALLRDLEQALKYKYGGETTTT
jgi:hypothetical protein